MHLNVTAEMGMRYSYIIITAVRNVENGVINVPGKESWERLMIHAIPLVQYMGKGPEGMHNISKM
jgi:hypothetical protein